MELSTIPLELRVYLGSQELNWELFASIAEGDVLVLNQSLESPLDILVENASKFKGRPVTVGKRKGIKMEEISE